MSTLTTIQSSDLITDSREDINNNFSALNSDKIETSYLDTDTSLTANSDTKIATQKAVKAYVDSGGNPNASETQKGVVEEATDAEVTAGTATGATGAKLFVTPAKLATRFGSGLFKFGGTGADGALTITSGATNIDLGSAQVVTKNYTSISITGTGSLTFTNPHTNGTTVILKSQGNVTLTSSTAPMIVASALGGSGGNGGSKASGDGSGVSAGSTGTVGTSTLSYYKTNAGTGATAETTPGSGGAVPAVNAYVILDKVASKYPGFIPGAGGGGGETDKTAGTGTATGGAGGKGGGTLIIECAGSLNFTTASGISVQGQNGGNGTVSQGSSSSVMAGGGGGGGGGVVIIVYNTVTANTGTITISGGTGGNGARAGTSNNHAGGGGGASIYAAGSNGSYSTTNGAKTGGDGATGYSLVTANTEFA